MLDSLYLWQIWIIIAVVCIVFEVFSAGFVLACFSIGAVAAAMVSVFGGIEMQILSFIIVSAACVVKLRPFAKRFLYNKEFRESNAEAIVGLQGRVLEEIPSGGFGRVMVGGDDWKAESVDEGIIPAGVKVEVVGRNSLVLKVKKI